MTNQELVHDFAHNTTSYESNSNKTLFFRQNNDGSRTIYSYGYHFPIARIFPSGIVLFTQAKYSNTTTQHISLVRQAVSHLNIINVFSLKDIDSYKLSKNNKKEVIKGLLSDIEKSIKKYLKALAIWRKDEYKSYILITNNELCKFVQEFKCVSLLPIKYKELLFVSDIESVLSVFGITQETIQKETQKEIENKLKQQKQRERDQAKAIELWRESNLNLSILFSQYTLLKLIDKETDSPKISTSKGVLISLNEANRVLKFITSLWSENKTWRKNGETFQIESTSSTFNLDIVQKDKIIAGCHTIERKEIETIEKDINNYLLNR